MWTNDARACRPTILLLWESHPRVCCGEDITLYFTIAQQRSLQKHSINFDCACYNNLRTWVTCNFWLVFGNFWQVIFDYNISSTCHIKYFSRGAFFIYMTLQKSGTSCLKKTAEKLLHAFLISRLQFPVIRLPQ